MAGIRCSLASVLRRSCHTARTPPPALRVFSSLQLMNGAQVE
jgi:ribosomal protein S12